MKYKFLVLIFFFPLIFGCGGSMIETTTSYFNTYYNAKQNYDDALKQVKVLSSRDKEKNLVPFQKLQLTTDAKTKFESVVEKSSKILQYYPQSSFFDDALLLIGNSYLYLGDYFKAERKFKEIIENFSQSNLYVEAKINLAKSYYFMKKQQLSIDIIGDSASIISFNDEDKIAEAFFLKGQIYYEEKKYLNAIKNLSYAFEYADDDLLYPQIGLQLGKLYFELNDYENASKIFFIVSEESNDYFYQSKALINYAIVLSKLNLCDYGTNILEEMKEDRRSKEILPFIEYEIGNILLENGDIDFAESQFKYIDTTYKRSDASAKANFKLGEIYETIQHNFDSAKNYYTKSKSEFVQSEITNEAKKKSDIFLKYFILKNSIRKFDSLQNLKQHPELIGIMDSIKKIEKVKQDSIFKFQKDSIRQYVADSLKDLGIFEEENFVNNTDSIENKIIENQVVNKNNSDSTFVDLKENQQQIDSLKLDFLSIVLESEKEIRKEKNIWDEDEENQEEIDSTKVFLSEENISDSISSGPEWLKDTIQIPLNNLLDSLSTRQYELGVLFFNKLNLKDSALFYFENSISTFPRSYIAPKVFYTIAQFYYDSVKTDSLYEVIIDSFPTHPISFFIKQKLGITILDIIKIDSCETIFKNGMKSFLNKDFISAIKIFSSIQDTISSFFPKSIYAIGWIYENEIKNHDSAISYYKILIEKFENSNFTKIVQRKVSAIDGKTTQYFGKKKYRTEDLQVNINLAKKQTGIENERGESQDIDVDFPELEREEEVEEEQIEPEESVDDGEKP